MEFKEFNQVLAEVRRMSSFAMGTILGKAFAQAQVHTESIAQVPMAQVLPMAQQSLCKTPLHCLPSVFG